MTISTTVEVTSFRTPLDPLAIEKRLRALLGAREVAANFASASATVTYDEQIADVILMKSDPADAVKAIDLSRSTSHNMHQSLWWAVGCKLIAFLLAARVRYPLWLSPEIAALSTSGSSALVAVNALLLKRTRLGGPKLRHRQVRDQFARAPA